MSGTRTEGSLSPGAGINLVLPVYGRCIVPVPVHACSIPNYASVVHCRHWLPAQLRSCLQGARCKAMRHAISRLISQILTPHLSSNDLISHLISRLISRLKSSLMSRLISGCLSRFRGRSQRLHGGDLWERMFPRTGLRGVSEASPRKKRNEIAIRREIWRFGVLFSINRLRLNLTDSRLYQFTMSTIAAPT